MLIFNIFNTDLLLFCSNVKSIIWIIIIFANYLLLFLLQLIYFEDKLPILIVYPSFPTKWVIMLLVSSDELSEIQRSLDSLICFSSLLDLRLEDVPLLLKWILWLLTFVPLLLDSDLFLLRFSRNSAYCIIIWKRNSWRKFKIFNIESTKLHNSSSSRFF